jgi:hypothetical protein
MGRRVTKAQSNLIAWAIVIGLPFYFISQLGESMVWATLIAIVAAIIVLMVVYKVSERNKRRAQLMEKYQDESLVDKLMERSFWQGQTSEQLFDSLGPPEDVDQKVLKTKKKEVWKYNHQGGNRFGLRITLDDDTVVGWDHKS